MGFIPVNDANDGSQLCIEAPQGVQSPPGLPTEEGVELISQTILSFEGGVTTFDTTDIKAKFEAAVVAAMASGPHGLLEVQCKVSVVTATWSGRRLDLSPEVQAEDAVATSNRDELVEVLASSESDFVMQVVQDAAADINRAVLQLDVFLGQDAAAVLDFAALNDLLTTSTAIPRRALTSGCYMLEMADSWGDGWSGNTWNWVDSSGVHSSNGTLSTGSTGTAQLCFPAGASCMDFSITQGPYPSFPSEVSWYITDETGAMVTSVRTMQTSGHGPLFTRAAVLHRH